MLSILGARHTFCDQLSRRGVLRIGALGLGAGALGLADLYRLDAAQSAPQRHKSVIHIFLGGGPPHQDMWEIKTEAPREIRGEFQPIATKVPGIEIGEVFTQIAARMDRCAVLRAVATNRTSATVVGRGRTWRWWVGVPPSGVPRLAYWGRSIAPCRRLSGWRTRGCGKIPGIPATSVPASPHSSPTGPGWRT
jgi:hypothetical protein